MRQSTRWFEFNGRRSDAFGMKVVEGPGRVRGAERGKWVAVPGRDGAIFQAEGGREDLKLAFKCLAPSARFMEIYGWLSGDGWLIDGERPDAAYRARPCYGFSAVRAAPDAELCALTIAFQAVPVAYLWPKQTKVFYGPTVVGNLGGEVAMPVLHLQGSGSATLSLGGRTLIIQSIPGTLTIDSEARIAHSGATLQTAQLTGDWPVIPKEGGALSWTGGIERVTMECNYRVG